MLYDLYEKKMKRRYYIKNLIIKHKVFIISIVSIISFLLITFLLTKGIIYDVSYTKHVRYGDNFEISAKGIFTDIRYEYSLYDQNDWGSKIPTTPGRYEVKVISNKPFNKQKEERYQFTIYPKQVNLTIVNNKVEFAKNPEILIDLIDGDKISSLSFTYADPSQTNTIANGYKITITNSYGDDVTEFYNIDFEESEVVFIPRNITVKLKDQEKVYDGTILESTQIEETDDLGEGHEIIVSAIGSQKEVGQTQNIIDEVMILDQNGVDVTKNYAITKETGVLNVIPREIVIKPEYQEKVYDATPLEGQNVQVIEGSLALNQIAEYEIIGSQVTVGSSNSVINNYQIFEGGEDVSHNYQIKYMEGELVVKPRHITVVFEDATKVYDGTNVFMPNYDLDLESGHNLVEGQTIVDIYNYSSNQDVGTWTSTSHDITIYDGNEDVTDNYDIDPIYGVLEITKRQITIDFYNATKVYDGTNVFKPQYNIDLESGHNLVLGQTIVDAYNYSSNQDVGTWTTIGHDITIYDGNKEVTDNYEIDSVYGILTITKRHVSIVFENATKIYDGTNILKPQYHLDLESGHNLALGQTIDLIAYASNQNVGIWTTINHDITIFNGNEEVTDNYEIDSVYGELEITKRHITVVFEDATKIYDGNNIFKPTYHLDLESGHNLVLGQTIDLVAYSSNQNVGIWTTTSHDITIYNGDEDVTDNYEIDSVNSVLEITKRQITIDFYDTTKVYDGTNVFNPQYHLDLESGHNLVLGQTIVEAYNYSSSQDVGTWATIGHDISIYDGNEEVTDNYEINSVYGSLTITKRHVSIVFENTTKIYDGNNIFTPQYHLDLESGSNLVLGQTIDLIAYASNQNVGIWTTIGHDITIYDGNEDVTNNYEIDTVYGELEITKRQITVVFEDTSKVYDGNNIFNPQYHLDLASGYDLVLGQTIDLIAYASNQNVGIWSTTSHDITIYNGNEDVTDNYDITPIYGELEITKRQITVDFYDTTKIYDGNNIFTPQYQLDLERGYNLVSGQIISEAYVYTADSNWGDSKTVESFNVSIINNKNEDVSENYEIIPVYGTFTINKRAISIIFDDETKIYDGNNIFTPQYHLDLESGNNLVLGQTIVDAYIYSSSQDVGTWATIGHDISIYDGIEDVTDNYDLAPVYGSLTINKRHISIVFENTSKVYDGTNSFKLDMYYFVSDTSLATNQAIDIRAYSSSQNVGIWATNSHEITIYDGNEDVTNNYEIDTVYGELEITKRQITVVFEDTSKVYDGNNVFNPQYHLDLASGYDLVLGQTVDLLAYSSNINVGIWTIINHELAIYNGNEDVTANYDITPIYGELEITKRQITVDFYDTTKIYDGNNIFTPQYQLDLESGYNLVSGQIISEAYVYTVDSNWGDSKTVGSFNVSIINNKNEDVSENYEIIPVYGTFTINKRAISIIFDDATKIYDGTNVFNPQYHLDLESGNNLVLGQTIVDAYIYSSSQDVGIWTTMGHDITIYDGSEDVTDNYDQAPVYGNLTINKRHISIVFENTSKVYDGTNSFKLDTYYFVSDTSLATNQAIDIRAYSSSQNVGIWATNSHDITIYDGNEDVTNNYEIDTVYGELEITKRQITVVFEDTSKVYDGNNIFNPQYHLDLAGGYDLVLGQTVDLLAYSSNINVGIWTIINHDLAIYDGIEDVTANYDITPVYGELEVTKRQITVDFYDTTKIYDGNNIFTPQYHLDLERGYNLVSGQIISEAYVYTVDSNWGDSKTVGSFNVSIMDSNYDDVSENYEIIPVYGTFTINKRAITIDFYDATKIYDGTNVFNPQYHLDLESGNNLVLGQTIVDAYIYSSSQDVGIWTTIGHDITIYNGIEDVTDNYEISSIYGVLEITKRQITVVFEDATKIYDGNNIFNPNYYLDLASGYDLVLGQTIDVIAYSLSENVGSWTPINHELTIYNGNEEVTDNYEITKVDGLLLIEPRPIEIELEYVNQVYNNQELTSNQYKEVINLVDGHVIYLLTATGKITNVGKVDNQIDQVIIHNEEGNDVTSNYAIEKIANILEVTPRLITIKSGDKSKVYDGTELRENYYQVDGDGVLSTHTLIVNITGSIIDIGKDFNYFSYQILDQEYNDVSYNYQVLSDYGILEILPPIDLINITIKSGSDSKEYDGTALTFNEWELTGQLQENHILEVNVTGEIINVGEIDNYFDFTIKDENGLNVEHLYDVEKIYGTLKIIAKDDLSNGSQQEEGSNISDTGKFVDSGDYIELFKIYSDINNIIYLREKSYGDYTFGEIGTSNWEVPPIYNGIINPLMIPGDILERSGNTTSTLKFKAIADNLSYYMPYYSIDGFNGSMNDTYITKPYGLEYTINYIPYSYNSDITLIEEQQSLLADYEQFVMSNYLTIPESTRIEMLKIAEKNNLNASNPTVIEDVQNYILNAGIYNFEHMQYPADGDFAVLFLNEINEGICQHFATSATVMYRALGIPARYTIGYALNVNANEWTSATPLNYHAWVEVYISGFGWVPIEVTPGSSNDDDSYYQEDGEVKVEENNSNEELPNIEIISHDAMKQYDGSPLSKDEYYIYGNLALNHEVVTINNSEITNIGTIRNIFSSTIVDKNTGEDVSYLYNIRHVYGDLVIVPNDERIVLEIKPFASKKVYDGIALELHKDDFWIPSGNLPEGYTIELEFDNTIKDVGIAEVSIKLNSVVIFDENGHDVTRKFNIVTYSEVLEVIKREIEVKTMSAQKVYDEKEFTHHVYSISKGSLALGHEIEIIWPDGGITEVGTLDNEITEVIIRDENGEDVTDNYYITKDIGTLEVYAE